MISRACGNPVNSPSQQFFSHVRTGLPGLNQHFAVNKVSCSRTQHNGSAGGEQPFDPQSNALPTEPLCSAKQPCFNSFFSIH